MKWSFEFKILFNFYYSDEEITGYGCDWKDLNTKIFNFEQLKTN